MKYLKSDRFAEGIFILTHTHCTSRCSPVPGSRGITYCTLFIPGGPIKLSEFRTTSDTRSSVSLSLVEQEPVAIIQECSLADSTFMTIESLIALWHTFIYESRCSTQVLS